MTLEEVRTLLEGIYGYTGKVTYYAWPVGEAPELPFLCYVEKRAENFAADNIVYSSGKEIDIELYTEQRSPGEEALVEAALTARDIYWEKELEYLDDEKCWMITYTIGV